MIQKLRILFALKMEASGGIKSFPRALSWLWSWVVAALAAPAALWALARRRARIVYWGSKFPGPSALPIIGNALDVFSQDFGVIHTLVTDLVAKFQPLGRFYMGPLLCVASSRPQDNEWILSGYKYLSKSFFYNKLLEPWLGTGLLLSSGDKWRSRRKVLTPAFHFRILEQFAPVFLSCGDEFVRQLRQRAGPDTFDVVPLVKLLTLDVICETAMGVKMNAQNDANSTYVQAVNEITTITARRALQPWLYTHSHRIWVMPCAAKSGFSTAWTTIAGHLTNPGVEAYPLLSLAFAPSFRHVPLPPLENFPPSYLKGAEQFLR